MSELDPTPTRTSTPVEPVEVASEQPAELSKKARKKLEKAAYFESIKMERRAREKEAKKEKKRVLAQKRAAGELDSEEEEQLRLKKKPKVANPNFNGKVVIDLGFDDKMSEKEVKSLCSQLTYTYSANRAALYPFRLLFTELNARTQERLDKVNDAAYKRWSKTEWWEGSYEGLWKTQRGEAGTQVAASHSIEEDSSVKGAVKVEGDAAVQETSVKEEIKEDTSVMMSEEGSGVKEKVVYLTADAEEELLELREDEIYIIGGICDHNRYKNLCLDRAKESGVRAARLPIGRYLAKFPTRKVLTVNQVLEILVHWVQTKDWEKALLSVMPKRKFQDSQDNKQTSAYEETKEEQDA